MASATGKEGGSWGGLQIPSRERESLEQVGGRPGSRAAQATPWRPGGRWPFLSPCWVPAQGSPRKHREGGPAAGDWPLGAPTKPGWGVGGPRRLPTAPCLGEPLVKLCFLGLPSRSHTNLASNNRNVPLVLLGPGSEVTVVGRAVLPLKAPRKSPFCAPLSQLPVVAGHPCFPRLAAASLLLLHVAFPPRHWASPPLRTPVTGFRAHPGPGGSCLEGFTSVTSAKTLTPSQLPF